ncbi:glycosyltransferase [Cellulomonas sp. KH9]|uniref:glycosyltransferase family 2 protein n=1 Tax=Cellulomonas sp. KH9 TaxID=1855324 RepID=UPI0008EA9D7D|nr:glycosyltransferase [Cellulomonas sp. KH9]SFK18456.1 Glycosyltransferase involved in cell wall bisynthesis [Cellulomonas sp. KH9]
MRPSVSVVIPTIGRDRLRDAVASVMAQSFPVHEVIVCVDSDADVTSLLPVDPRVRALRVGPGAGGNAARQCGVMAATGDLVALLDDDDLWAAEKLTTQLELIGPARLDRSDWIATSRLVARSRERDEIWPARLIEHDESVTEYICRKHRIKGGQGFIQASTLLFPRSLALRVPFDESLRFHQDVAWLLDVDQRTPSLEIVQADEALTVYVIGEPSISGGTGIAAKDSAMWAEARITGDGRSLGDFILTTSTIYAARRGSPAEVLSTIRRGVSVGSPGVAAFGFAAYQFVRATLLMLRK